MKIRSQFMILVAGIAVGPPLILILLFGLLYLAQPKNELPGYDELSQTMGAVIDKKQWAELNKYVVNKPKDFDLVLLTKDYEVIYSTIDRFQAGAHSDKEAVGSYLLENLDRYYFQLDIPDKEGLTFAILRITKKANEPPDRVLIVLFTLIVVVGSLLLVASAGSMILARSSANSIMKLEAATRKVAGGDLDMEIDAKGSDEIRSLAASINSMRQALKDANTRRARFVMGISHDLKSPLALIKGYVEALEDGLDADPEQRKHYTDIILSKADQLDSMIDDLIDFVKVDTGTWLRELRATGLKSFLEGFCQRMEVDARVLKRNFLGDLRLSEDLSLAFDQKLIQRSLENIVFNALRYTDEGGHIWLRAYPASEREILLEVEDDGRGIDPEDLAYVFDPFYRASSSRREQGMGLGLSIVKTLVESHGWKIELRSEKGRGTCFTLRIPAQKHGDL